MVAQLQGFSAVWLYVCAFIAATSGATAAVVKVWRYAHRATDEHTDHLSEIDSYLDSDKRRIESLERRQDSMAKEQKMQLRALMTIMSHFLDGNHTSQLQEVRDDINSYLITR